MENHDNKTYSIVIMILLFIVGVGVGYLIPDFKESEKTEKINERVNKNETVEVDRTIKKGSLKTDKTSSIEIALNGKTHMISYVFNHDEEGPGSYSLKFDNTFIIDNIPAVNGISDVKYETFYDNENKGYILISYSKFAEYGYILDENGNILKSMDYNNDAFECVMDIEESSKIYVKNGIVYYYKYVEGSKKDDEEDNSIKMELFKVEIKNGKAVESSTNKKVNGKLVNCA